MKGRPQIWHVGNRGNQDSDDSSNKCGVKKGTSWGRSKSRVKSKNLITAVNLDTLQTVLKGIINQKKKLGKTNAATDSSYDRSEAY